MDLFKVLNLVTLKSKQAHNTAAYHAEFITMT